MFYLLTEYTSLQVCSSEWDPSNIQDGGFSFLFSPVSASAYRRSSVARGSSVKFSIFMCRLSLLPMPLFIGSGIFCTNHFSIVQACLASVFALWNYFIFTFVILRELHNKLELNWDQKVTNNTFYQQDAILLCNAEHDSFSDV